MYINMHIFFPTGKKKRNEADLFIFDPNPFSRPSGPGGPLLSNKWLAASLSHASLWSPPSCQPRRCFPPSSCSCLKVEVISPERNTLGVLQSINLLLLFYPRRPPSQLEQIPLFLPLLSPQNPSSFGDTLCCAGWPPVPRCLRLYHPARRGRLCPTAPPSPPPLHGSGVLPAPAFACTAVGFRERRPCFPLGAAPLWPLRILPFSSPRQGLGMALRIPPAGFKSPASVPGGGDCPPAPAWLCAIAKAVASRRGFEHVFQSVFPFLVYSRDSKQSVSPLIIVSGSDV